MSQLMEYREGMDYGVGVDSLGGAIRGDGVIRTEAEDVTKAKGQDIEFHLEKIETVEDLMESLSVSAEAEASYGPFASGSARTDFSESCAVHSYSLYLLVRAEIENSFRQMRDIRFKPQAIDLLRNGKLGRFREQYGDMFVRGMSTGGAYFAVLEIQTKSEEEKQNISGEFEVSAGMGTFEASGEFSKAVSKVVENKSVQVRSFQQGGFDTRQPTTPEEMIAKATNFAEQVAGEHAVPYEVLFQDYKTLDMPDLPNFIDLLNAKEVLQDLAIMRNDLRMKRNDINYILTHQEQFIDPDIKKLNTIADDLSDTIKLITRGASRCINKPLEAEIPKGLNIPEITLPARKDGKPITTPKFNPRALRAAAKAYRQKKQEERQKKIKFDFSKRKGLQAKKEGYSSPGDMGIA